MAENEKTQDDIPDHLVDQLRCLLKLHKVEDLPKDVVREFWKLKVLFDRIGANVSGHPLGLMVYKMGFADGISIERPKRTIRDLWKSGEIGSDAPVVVQWRKKDVEGVLKNVTNGGLIIQMAGDSEERVLKDEQVQLMELATV